MAQSTGDFDHDFARLLGNNHSWRLAACSWLLFAGEEEGLIQLYSLMGENYAIDAFVDAVGPLLMRGRGAFGRGSFDVRMLEHKELQVRMCAIRLLGSYRQEGAFARLLEIRKRDSSALAREEAARAGPRSRPLSATADPYRLSLLW